MIETNPVKIKHLFAVRQLHPDAKLPTRATEGAAGLDLYSVCDCGLPPNTRLIVPTGLAMELPEGRVGFIWPRSGWAVKYGIDRLAGVIDCDYRGEVGVVLHNDGSEYVKIKKGDRVAQMVIQKYEKMDPVWASSMGYTDRGEGGFGSSGM